ncbi:aldehyde dehydrogenase family protein [Paeniglutamicibacter antarcticus]|uniref:aldehyde dehydrogenase family protein n=1 Tax=Paeniglutamicibacter antarcticus TaxID=494023 RepID=UPI0031E881EE
MSIAGAAGIPDGGIEMANDTHPYGLASWAWTSNVNLAVPAAAEIQAGCVRINEHIPILVEMPHGGYKASGFGKDMSTYFFEDYTTIKHVLISHGIAAHKQWQYTFFGST